LFLSFCINKLLFCSAFSTVNNVIILMERNMAERWAVWPTTSLHRHVAATVRGKLVSACVSSIV